MKTMIAFLAAPLLLTGAMASAAPMAAARQPVPAEASIPFVNHGGVWNWQADGSHGLYVQDQHRRWYYAKLMGNCFDLPFANAVGFETRGIDTLDKFGTVIVRGQRCPIMSFTLSDGPPVKAKKG
ncbi:DUF6491 family protein [Sphingobium estronivorans]|uniref:DUF6491 family protein n=1 Tax=Sphingobium estronivorans TaxID=1577690 RepID=UPI001F0788B0|nr:DUF6491 family protein [Sphingobium estronivorans]